MHFSYEFQENATPLFSPSWKKSKVDSYDSSFGELQCESTILIFDISFFSKSARNFLEFWCWLKNGWIWNYSTRIKFSVGKIFIPVVRLFILTMHINCISRCLTWIMYSFSFLFKLFSSLFVIWSVQYSFHYSFYPEALFCLFLLALCWTQGTNLSQQWRSFDCDQQFT